MSVSPASGPLAGGTVVTITGSRLRSVTAVTIGGASLDSMTVVSDTQLTGTTPAASVAGAVDVVVDADGERRTCHGCFTYFDLPMGPAARLAGGGAHTCQLDAAGAAYCWGANWDGQLGDGTTADRATPVAVSGGLSFVALAAGGLHTCGLTGSGTAYCWGGNASGQLGDGTTTDQPTPVSVTGGLSFLALGSGDRHTCGVSVGGTAYCWGWSRFGQLGDGTMAKRATPGAVSGGLSFVTVTGGSEHTCGLTGSGAAYCWGRAMEGQLGEGSIAYSTLPVAVALLTGGPSPQAFEAAPTASRLAPMLDPRTPCLRAERSRPARRGEPRRDSCGLEP